MVKALDVHVRQLGDVPIGKAEEERLLFKSGALTVGAGDIARKLFYLFLGLLAVVVVAADVGHYAVEAHHIAGGAHGRFGKAEGFVRSVKDDVHGLLRDILDGVVEREAVLAANGLELPKDERILECANWLDAPLSDA